MSTLSVMIHGCWNEYEKTWSYKAFHMDMTDCGYVYLETKQIEFKSFNDRELKELLVNNLRNKQGYIMANAHRKKVEIEEKIQSLLALEDLS